MRPLNPKHRAVDGAHQKASGPKSHASARVAKKPVKDSARRKFGNRTQVQDNILSRTLTAARERLGLNRPILVLTGSLVALTIVAAWFIGGYERAAIGAVDRGVAMVSSDAGFGISNLRLSGENRTSPQSILAVLNFRPGQSIFGADLQIARERLLELPWIASVDISRRYPDTISVHIVEKRPFALWQSSNGLDVIERSGAIVTKASLAEFRGLPIFIGDAPNGGDELVDAIDGHKALMTRVRAMERISQRRWNLILDDGVVVKLPENDWKQQLDVLEHLIADKAVLERDITEIDLRSRENYFFVLHGEKKRPVARESAA